MKGIGSSSTKSIPTARLPETTDQFIETACDTKLDDYAAQCGYVLVPEEPKSERIIAIKVMRIFSNAEKVEDSPIVYLEGGPGASVLADAEAAVGAFEDLLDHRDLIFFDQRGVGDTLPALECSETSLSDCFKELSKEVKLSAYNSKRNASDVEAIRKALGYRDWNLYGISYGTRLGLTVLRDYPNGVRAAVLDSVVPLEADLIGELSLNAQSAFEKVFAACESDTSCNSKYPSLMGTLRTTVATLNDAPRKLATGDLTGDQYINVLFNFLYSVPVIEMVPMIISDAAAGDFSVFDALAGGIAIGGGSGFSFPMHLSLHCAEEVPFTSAAQLAAIESGVLPEFRAALSGEQYLGYCAEWPVEVAAKSENEPVVSSLPQLYFAGYFDPITPVEYTKSVADAQPSAGYFEVAAGSHGASVSACGLAVVNRFFDDPKTVPEAQCLNLEPNLRFESFFGAPQAARFRFADSRPDEETIEDARQDLRRRLR